MTYSSYPEAPSIVPRPAPAREVEKFNAMFPVGTLVRYWDREKVGKPVGIARTSVAAYVFGNTVAAVWLDGVANAIPLANVEVIS